MVFTADEATDLLYKLQEIDAAVAQGAGEDYLAVLMKKRGLQGAKEALAALQPVRLALARYMGRCHVVHVGGRDTSALPPRAGAGLVVHG
jgi:nuclear pore complex protein Nup85